MMKCRVLILSFMCLALCFCARKEPGATESKTAVSTAVTDTASPLMTLFPSRNEVPGWAMKERPRTFDPANLYEFIDGAADGYLAYGFQEVASVDYEQQKTGFQAVVDVYHMKDTLNAYGIYSEERNPEYSFTQVGNEGYSGGTSLNFWAGEYYVKITIFDEKDALKKEIAKLAAAVAGKITTPGSEPAEVAYFPKANLLSHSTVYIPKDVLAQSYLANGFESKYRFGDKEGKLVLIEMESPASAQVALARYRQFESVDGRATKDIKTPGEGGFSGKDSFYGSMTAVRSGKNLVIALGMPSEETGKKMIGELLANIK